MSKHTKTLKDNIERSIKILDRFCDPKKRNSQNTVPPSVLEGARGLVFVRLRRFGLVVSARSGTGIIISKLPDGSWSAPSSISMQAMGFGHIIGGDIIDSMIVISHPDVLDRFVQGGETKLGINAGISAGSYGCMLDLSFCRNMPTSFVYSITKKGAYMGYGYEASRITPRADANTAFYGRPVSAHDILSGAVTQPIIAEPLYEKIDALLQLSRELYRAPSIASTENSQEKRDSSKRPMSEPTITANYFTQDITRDSDDSSIETSDASLPPYEPGPGYPLSAEADTKPPAVQSGAH